MYHRKTPALGLRIICVQIVWVSPCLTGDDREHLICRLLLAEILIGIAMGDVVERRIHKERLQTLLLIAVLRRADVIRSELTAGSAMWMGLAAIWSDPWVSAWPFLLLYLVSRGRWIGGGDVKLMWIVGLLLGGRGGMAAMTLGCLISLLYAAIDGQMYGKVPLGPGLSLGIWIMSFQNMGV